MTLQPNPPFVSEHQPGTDWDCVGCSLLMLALAAKPGCAPATLAEAKAIRKAAGLPATGPTGIGQTLPGLAKRTGVKPTNLGVMNFASYWNRMPAGVASAVIIKPSLLPVTHVLRRYQRNFTGSHCIFASRRDTTDWLWTVDPEGPDKGYSGAWVSKADLAKCYTAEGACVISIVIPPPPKAPAAIIPADPIVPAPTHVVPTIEDRPETRKVGPGTFEL